MLCYITPMNRRKEQRLSEQLFAHILFKLSLGYRLPVDYEFGLGSMLGLGLGTGPIRIAIFFFFRNSSLCIYPNLLLKALVHHQHFHFVIYGDQVAFQPQSLTKFLHFQTQMETEVVKNLPLVLLKQLTML